MITIDPIRRPSKRNVTIEDINELNEKIKDITIKGIPDKSITTDKVVDGAVTTAKLSQAVKDSINSKADKSALENYATKEALAGKANATELSNKADKSELANYATTEALSQKADASALNDKADKSALANYATKESLDNYATNESLVNFATKEEVEQMTETTASIAPNILYVWGEVAELNITLADGEKDVVNEYMVQFTSGAIATTLTLPDSIVWMSLPNIQANKTYLLSIINNLGVIGEFSHE